MANKKNKWITIKLVDDEFEISGKIDLGYMGTYIDSQIEMDDDIDDAIDWDIVCDNLPEDCSDRQVVKFLNEHFNKYIDKISENIKLINDTFLLEVFLDMAASGMEFWKIPELYIEDKNPYEDIESVYSATHDGLTKLSAYLDAPNDGSVDKGDIEAELRALFPMFNFDEFIAGVVPESIELTEDGLCFQCSDKFGKAILCGAYDELDEELCFTDWHNF